MCITLLIPYNPDCETEKQRMYGETDLNRIIISFEGQMGFYRRLPGYSGIFYSTLFQFKMRTSYSYIYIDYILI